MNKIKILVTGANGQLANCIKDELQKSSNKHIEADFVTHEEFDITDRDMMEDYFETNSGWKYNYLINCAAYTNVNGSEDPEVGKELANAVNHIAPVYLSHLCEKYKVSLIHISTDYVFPGLMRQVKETMDDVEPVNYYGKSKLLGEKAIIDIADKCNLQYMIIRTSWLYSEYGNNFVKSILKQYLSGKELNVVYDQLGSPTSAHDLADFIIGTVVSKDNLSYDNPIFKSGIYHFSNDGVISWFDFAKAIIELYTNLAKKEAVMIFNDPVINPISEVNILNMMSENGKPVVHRPAISMFDKTNTKSTGYVFRYWKDSLNDVINKIMNKLDK